MSEILHCLNILLLIMFYKKSSKSLITSIVLSASLVSH
nr:MAG TPA: hypothetical protein [Caudoviricetes sp.]